MTIVIALQILLAALAGLLLLETRVRHGEQRRRAGLDASVDVDFHPELIVAWDDEANYARHRPCTRRIRRDEHEMRRSSLVPVSPHQHLR